MGYISSFSMLFSSSLYNVRSVYLYLYTHGTYIYRRTEEAEGLARGGGAGMMTASSGSRTASINIVAARARDEWAFVKKVKWDAVRTGEWDEERERDAGGYSKPKFTYILSIPRTHTHTHTHTGARAYLEFLRYRGRERRAHAHNSMPRRGDSEGSPRETPGFLLFSTLFDESFRDRRWKGGGERWFLFFL